jgi:hypothetical protein
MYGKDKIKDKMNKEFPTTNDALQFEWKVVGTFLCNEYKNRSDK